MFSSAYYMHILLCLKIQNDYYSNLAVKRGSLHIPCLDYCSKTPTVDK